jgi:hypothetical protein
MKGGINLSNPLYTKDFCSKKGGMTGKWFEAYNSSNKKSWDFSRSKLPPLLRPKGEFGAGKRDATRQVAGL